MDKEDLKNSNFVIDPGSSIKEAMVAISDNHRGTVVVVDDDLTFQGIVADGDIRRAMLKGALEVTPIIKIINQNPIIIYEDSDLELKSHELFKENSAINILPVINKDNKLVDIIVRDQPR